MSKITHNQEFIPCNPAEAKRKTAADNFGLYNDHYESKRMHDYEQHQFMKSKYVAGDFKRSNNYDYGKDVDEFGVMKNPAKSKDMKKSTMSKNKMSLDEEGSTRS